MTKTAFALMALVVFGVCAVPQTEADDSFKLVLPDHQGQLSWTADGFKIIQTSAKPGAR